MIQEPNLNGLNIDKWIPKSKKWWLTIKDIEKLKKGEKIKILLMDRNLYDIITTTNKPNKLYKPRYFFRINTVIYEHEYNLVGKIKYNWDHEFKKFEFQIEYKKDNWYPLKNGILPQVDPQGFVTLLDEEKKWNEFSKLTHVGWRGPMMLWKNVEKMPDIYWYEQ